MARQRITITLKDEILKLLDQEIDGEKIRNRSHAVEYLLSRALSEQPAKVLILAGGKGVDFTHLSSDLPKAMLPVGGVPLLEHTINKLRNLGLTDITISVGQGGQKIKDYFRNGSKFGVKISYLDQIPGKKGTAQPLKQAEEKFSVGTFLLIYGDVFTNLNFKDLFDYHRLQSGLIATMALTSVEKVSMWGVARLIGSKIVEFEEKPKNPKTHSHLVNAGIYVLGPQIFNFIHPDDVKLESSVFPRLAEENRLSGYIFDSEWLDISTEESYRRLLSKFIASGKVPK